MRIFKLIRVTRSGLFGMFIASVIWVLMGCYLWNIPMEKVEGVITEVNNHPEKCSVHSYVIVNTKYGDMQYNVKTLVDNHIITPTPTVGTHVKFKSNMDPAYTFGQASFCIIVGFIMLIFGLFSLFYLIDESKPTSYTKYIDEQYSFNKPWKYSYSDVDDEFIEINL